MLLKTPCDAGVIQGGQSAVAPPAKPGTERWTLAAAVLGSSMVFVDGTVVNVALPRIQAELKATAGDAQWVVEAYALLLAALILAGGALGDHLGRRRVFGIGVAVFAAASVWCGLAPTITQLILARAVQGIGGALLTPGSLALISAAFDEKRRGQAIGAWSGWTTITSGAGPVLGGWLVQNASWRWVFFLNVPLALAVLVLLRNVPESKDPKAGRSLDGTGAALATVGLAGVVYGLIAAGGAHPSALTVGVPLAGGAAALAGFFRWEARVAEPMMPPALFGSRTFLGANLLTLLLYAALGGALYFLPFDLIQVQHYSATAAGAALLPFVVLMSVLARWSGGLVQKYGAKRPLMLGPAIAGLGFLLMLRPGVSGGSYWTTWFPAVCVLGLGMALTVAPLTTAVMTAVSDGQAGLASGVNNAVSRVASLLSVALLGLAVALVFQSSLTHRLAARHAPPAIRRTLDAQKSRLASITLPPGMAPSERRQWQAVIAGAFVDGFRTAMILAALLAFGSSLFAWKLIDEK